MADATGNYPAYCAKISATLNGEGKPGPGQRGDSDNDLIELGIESARHRATLSLV